MSIYVQNDQKPLHEGSARRRRPLAALASAFVAGALAVGGLAYAADANDWFGGASGPLRVDNAAGGPSAAPVSYGAGAADLYDRASPAVVQIETYAAQPQADALDPFFRQFYGMPNDDSPDSAGGLAQSGVGSGFIYDESGYILTNQHVVAGADEIRVVVEGYDEPLAAELTGYDYGLDLAVLKIESPDGQPFPTLPLGRSGDMRIGDPVFAIGSPYGFDHTLTTGVLSAKGRSIELEDEHGVRAYEGLLQTDTSINPGNSGGPLLNAEGEVVGMNTAIEADAQGIGFVISSETIRDALDSLQGGERTDAPARRATSSGGGQARTF